MGSRHAITPVGFALLDERWAASRLDATETTATAHTPRPGGAVGADAQSDLIPVMSGGQQSDVDVVVSKAGRPSIAVRGCEVAYKLDSEAATQWRGWAAPNWMHHWSPVDFSSSTTWDSSDCAVLPVTQKVIATRAASAGGSMGGRVWTPSTRTWSSTWTTTQVARGPVTICVMPETNRVLHLGFDQGGSLSPHVEYSDDAFTFAKYSANPFPDGLPSGTLVRCRMRPFGDSVLLLVENSAGTLYQYASDDLGATFTLVSSITGTKECALAITPSGVAVVSYISTANNRPQAIVLGAAYERIEDIAATEVDTATGSYLELVADPGGTLWLYMKDASTPGVRLFMSVDDGASWAESPWGVLNTASQSPTRFAAAATDGEILLLHSATSGTYAGSLYSALLGGWSNVTNGNASGGTSPVARTSMSHVGNDADTRTWVGMQIPTSMLWSATGSGTLTLDSTTAEAVFDTTSTTHRVKPTGTIPSAPTRCVAMADLKVTTGGSTSASSVVLRVTVGDTSTYDYKAELRFSTTGIQLYDPNASTVGTALSEALSSTGMQVMLVVTTGTAAFYYRRPGDQNWTKHASGGLTNGGGEVSDVIVGHFASSTSISRWRMFGYAFDAYLAEAIDQTYVTGKALARYPYPLARVGSATAAAFLRLEGGAARFGATYDIDADADFPVRNVFPATSPSPDDVWRSTQGTTTEAVVCDLSGADTLVGSSWCWVLFVSGSNVRKWTLGKKDNGGGSYTTLGTLDLATGFTGLAYALNGDVVAPNLSTTIDAGRYIQDNEFAGGYIVLDTGGTATARRILSNTAGGWTQNGTVVPRFVIELSGGEVATGLCEIVAPQGVLVIPQTEASANLTRYLSVSPVVEARVDAYFQAGTVFVGAVLVPGKGWSRGWTFRYEPNVDVKEDSRGTIRHTQRGKSRRVFTWNHADGVKMDRVRGGVDLDYLSASSATAALAARDDVLWQYIGMLDRTKGGELPVIMLAALPETATTYTDRSVYVYGLLSGSPQFANVVGKLGTNAFVRGEPLTIKELV